MTPKGWFVREMEMSETNDNELESQIAANLFTPGAVDVYSAHPYVSYWPLTEENYESTIENEVRKLSDHSKRMGKPAFFGEFAVYNADAPLPADEMDDYKKYPGKKQSYRLRNLRNEVSIFSFV